jgi:hypothetical protein
MLGLVVTVAMGDCVLVGVRVAATVSLGIAVQSGVVVGAVGLLQAKRQQQTVNITNNNWAFFLLGDRKE